jgi:predicted ATP-dependent serine protease
MKNVNVVKRGRPSSKSVQNVTYTPSLIDFSNVTKLSDLNIDSRMMNSMKSGLNIDSMFSHEGGIPAATNIMMIGDPGVGKTTVLLDVLSAVQNKGSKCLFISGEIDRKSTRLNSSH